ncbi:MAG: hypothetical protein SFV19_06245 [Rhodospirillaceae bacterium]|nr:hypothetical protein [Rhodospirillaceae bacterium]
MTWTSLTTDEARAHRLYGFGGWMIAVYVLALLLLAMNLRNLAGGDAMMLIMFETEAQVAMARQVMVVQTIALLPFLVLAPLKHPAMPTAALVGFAVYALARPLAVALLMDINPVKVMAVSGNHLVIGAIFIGYVLLSKRVNVTYRHRVKAA